MNEVERLAEKLYVEAMRSGRRERYNLPVDASYWEAEARRQLAAQEFISKPPIS